jgi:hypothetical protein
MQKILLLTLLLACGTAQTESILLIRATTYTVALRFRIASSFLSSAALTPVVPR